jgi:hypothetical protein
MSTASQPPAEVSLGKPPRAKQTVSDMMRTMLVVGGFVLFLAVMVWRPWHYPTVRTVDWKSAAAVSASSKVIPVWAPTALPPGWKATSARIDTVQGGHAWVMGTVTAHNDYAALAVTNSAPLDYLTNNYQAGLVQSGTVTIGGLKWTTYEVPGARDHALVRTDAKGISWLLFGTAPYADLTTLLARLHVIG